MEKLTQVLEILKMVETKGDSTMIMAQAMSGLSQIIQEIQAENQEATDTK